MADVNQQFINEIANNMLKPTIVDTLVCDDWEYDLYINGEFMNTIPAKYTLKFIGYALPTCTGMDDPKWLIQLNMKVDIDMSSIMQVNDGGGGNGVFIPDGDDNGSGKINTRSSSIKKSSGAKVMDDGYYPIGLDNMFPTQRSIIGFANGVRDFNQKWTDRMRLAYAVAKGSMPFYKEGCAMNEFFEFGNPSPFSPMADFAND
jgi:hypothetical protein